MLWMFIRRNIDKFVKEPRSNFEVKRCHDAALRGKPSSKIFKMLAQEQHASRILKGPVF